jgi:hypothetical protein
MDMDMIIRVFSPAIHFFRCGGFLHLLYGVLDDEKYNKILVVHVYTNVPCFVRAKSKMYLLYYPKKINVWRIVLVLMNFPDNFEYHQVMQQI